VSTDQAPRADSLRGESAPHAPSAPSAPSGDATARPPSVAPSSVAPRSYRSVAPGSVAPESRLAPIARRAERRKPGDPFDPPAAVAALRTRIRQALASGDVDAETTANARLTRLLTKLDARLEEAVLAGRRAIAQRSSDVELREAIGALLQALGEPGLAAATLRPVVDDACARANRDSVAADEAVAGLLRLGDLLLRAGDVDGALESFRYVAVVAPDRPEGQERIALARGTAPDTISTTVAARAWIGAAKKHQLLGGDGRAIEALARAFETDPLAGLPASVYAEALEDLGRFDAADAVRAEHATLLANAGGGAGASAAAGESAMAAAMAVHEDRRERARARNDFAAVLVTVLDPLVDGVRLTEPGSAARLARTFALDESISTVPALALARLRLRAATESSADAALAATALRAATELAPPGSAARVVVLADRVSLDLGDALALAELRDHATANGNPALLADALVRALRSAPDAAHVAEPTHRAGLRSAALELAQVADERPEAPALARWALERAREAIGVDAEIDEAMARLHARVGAADAQLEAARRDAESGDRAVRVDGRRRAIRLLLERPDEASAVVRLAERALDETPGDLQLVRALDRVGASAPTEIAEGAYEARERASTTAIERLAARVLRAEMALRRGDFALAKRLLSETKETRAAGSAWLVAIAERAGGGLDLAEALATMELPTPRERAVVLAAAARAARGAGDATKARALAEEAMRSDPRDLRGAVQLAELAVDAPDALPAPLAGASLERALAGVGARARWSLELAKLAEAAHEAPLASAWTRRAWSLRPGDPEIARSWLRRAIALGDAELIVEVVRTTTAHVASMGALAHELASALSTLAPLDARLFDRTARELLALGAARLAEVRQAIHEGGRDGSQLPGVSANASLRIATLERWLASGAQAAERAGVLLDIAVIARDQGDFSRAADAVCRALAEPEASHEERALARGMLSPLLDAKLGADAELAVRSALVDRDAEELAAALGSKHRHRLDGALELQLVAVADAHRALGRDLWDLAEDHDAALRAWLKGALLLGDDGVDRLEADIAHFGGEAAARDALFELAHRVADVRGYLQTEGPWPPGRLAAGWVAAFHTRAWDRVLRWPPSWVEPVSLAREAAAISPDPAALLPSIEEVAVRLHRPEFLADVYEIAAGRAAGRYGERGVRYRAARVLDRLSRPEEALVQAVRAFGAVPSEGAILLMLQRLSQTTGDAEPAVRVLIEAAEQADDPEKRATWLDRAATIASVGIADPSDRVDVLLRLFLTAPSAKTCAAVVDAMRAAVALDTNSRETWSHRLLRAHKKVDAKLGYVDRLPVLAVVATAIAELTDVGAALDLVANGAQSTPRNDLDPLRDVAESIARLDAERALSWLDGNPRGNVVRAHVAWDAGDADRAIALLGEFAPEQDDLGFEEEGDTAGRELALLEAWAKHAHDKRAVAAAWARFGKSAGTGAELETVRAQLEAGQIENAARALVASWKGRDASDLAQIEELAKLAREVLPSVAMYVELAAILEEDLARVPERDTDERVTRWRELAVIRSEHLGDKGSALDALVEAGRASPTNDDLWTEIAELAESIGAHDRLAAALAQRLQRARPDRRVTLLRKLARVLEHDLGRDAEAAERWAELVRLLPLDAEAADALERIAERRGDRNQLVELLRSRASRLPVGHADRTRALRRVARELDAQPGRRGEVLAALREVHQQAPGDTEVALQLARIARAAGDVSTAAEALMRAYKAAPLGPERLGIALDAARALLELQDHDSAGRVLAEVVSTPGFERDPRALDLIRLELEVAIARGDARAEAYARMRLVELDVDAPPARRAANGATAARSLLALGEAGRARDLAWMAARATPADPAVLALLVELEFGAVSGRAPGEARSYDDELLSLLGRVPHGAQEAPELLALVAFGRAEILDRRDGIGAGYRDLHGWAEPVRAQPLVQLALAERLAAEWSFAPASVAFERAFGGDLKGVRAVGPTALRAAEAAARCNDPARAGAFLELAARDPACRIDARRRAVELARARGDAAAALDALQRLAAESTGNVRAQALAEQARMLRAADPLGAIEAMKRAFEAAEPGSAIAASLEAELAEIDTANERTSLPPQPPPSLRDSVGQAAGAGSEFERAWAEAQRRAGLPVGDAGPPRTGSSASLQARSVSEPPPADLLPRRKSSSQQFAAVHVTPVPPRAEQAPTPEAAPPAPPTTDPGDASLLVPEAPELERPSTPAPELESGQIDLELLDRIALDPSAPVDARIHALTTLGEALHAAGRDDDATRHFIAALELGDVTAGDSAAEILALLPGRSADVLLVRRRQAFLIPGDRALLDHLHAAALHGKDHVFARAIDHVRRSFDPIAGPVPPPPLDAQLDRPELIVPLLERRANPVAAEAVRLGIEHAPSVFRRDFSAFSLQASDRVPPIATHPIGRLIAVAERLLGLARTPVYVRTRRGRDVEAVLLQPPSVVLGGDCREDTPEVRYLLGAGLMAAHPAQCLLLAQSEPHARATWQALLSAFGPPEFGRGMSPEVGRLAALLWQSIPRGPQRRLGELLGQTPPSFEAALDGGRQVARRAGLYLSGDLAAAVRLTLEETGHGALLASPDSGTLARACAQSGAVADLVRLATSPEFAEARWRHPAASNTSRRKTPTPPGTRLPR
jgi:hypothetical protein